jgi:hypothetical protein
VRWLPLVAAREISVSARERTSAPVWRAAVTNDLPVALSVRVRSGARARRCRAERPVVWCDPTGLRIGADSQRAGRREL